MLYKRKSSKAFDRVNFWLLFQKLLSRNVPLFIVRILAMWYTHQKMCIRWGNAISPSFTVSNGVKQGGIISPILFNVYMDGLSVLLNSSNIGGQIGYTFLNHLCYADDLCLISLSSAGMQKLLNLCSKYAVDHSLTYNAKKSFSLCFIPRTVKISRPQLYLNTLVIPHVSECKYLGIIVCQKNCDRDLKRQMKKFYANANMLLRRFSKCSIPVKCYLFKTYCSNLYCAPLWYNFTLTAMKKIKIAYNNSIRRLFFLPKHNSASEMCVNLNIMSFGELLRKYVYSFRFRLGASLNCIIDNIYSSNVPLHSDIWAWWHSILAV